MKLTTYLFAFILLALVSCKDECKDLNCNYGTCDDGTCICDDGYEGANCDTEQRIKFIGNWNGVTSCSIDEEPDGLIIITKDLNNLFFVTLSWDGITMLGKIEGNNLVVDKQTVEDEIEVSGTGSILPDKRFEFNIKAEFIDQGIAQIVNCSYLGSK